MVCVFREAYANCGYSPFLSFEVIDLQSRVQSLLELGAVLDGPIKYAERGKVIHYLCLLTLKMPEYLDMHDGPRLRRLQP